MSERSGFNSWRGLVVTVAAVAGVMAAVNVARGWVSGPTVSLGSNPLKTFAFEAEFVTSVTSPQTGQIVSPGVKVQKKVVYEVPQGQALLIRSVRNMPPLSGKSCKSLKNSSINQEALLIVDGTYLARVNAYEAPQELTMETGFVAKPGSKVELELRADIGSNSTTAMKCKRAMAIGGQLFKS